MANYLEIAGTTICPAGGVDGEMDADVTTRTFAPGNYRTDRGAEPWTFYVSWTAQDTPTGVLYMRESYDESTWRNVKIPVAAVHDISSANASLVDGAINITDGAGYVVLRFVDIPRRFHFFYDRTSGGSAGGPAILTIEAR